MTLGVMEGILTVVIKRLTTGLGGRFSNGSGDHVVVTLCVLIASAAMHTDRKKEKMAPEKNTVFIQGFPEKVVRSVRPSGWMAVLASEAILAQLWIRFVLLQIISAQRLISWHTHSQCVR